MNVDYIHAANMTIPSANTLQVARMCESFARVGAVVSLWYPGYSSRTAVADWRAHYGVVDVFSAHELPTLLTERLYRTQALPALKLAGYARLLSRFRLAPPTVIYTRCFAAAAFFPRAVRAILGRRRPPVVFEAHELPPTYGRAAALRGVDAIVAITRAAADDIITRLRFPRERVIVEPDGVPDAWLTDPIEREQAREHLGIAAPRPLLVYTGRFHEGTAQLLRTTADALRGEADILAVGPGAEAARVHASDNLAFLDEVPATTARMYQAAADILLMPHVGVLRWSRYTSPLKLFEYMAAQRPIIASHLPVLDEVIRHREHAWLVPLGSGDALASGVRAVLSDAARAREMVARAAKTVSRYTWNTRARSILTFLRDLPERR